MLFFQIVTDRSFLSGVYEAARAHVQVAPTYSYLFDFNGKYNMIVNYGYPASEWGIVKHLLKYITFLFRLSQIEILIQSLLSGVGHSEGQGLLYYYNLLQID